uniref:Uncharacterized protein n=1 Tax=Kalanchoe fedtschenkoi TaxID=63787 RepID=A0A7N1A864_KALFE
MGTERVEEHDVLEEITLAGGEMVCLWDDAITTAAASTTIKPYPPRSSSPKCSLETWYYMALILFAGYVKNAEIAVDALSICMNIVGWAVMLAIGFNAAISVRVSNELGAARPRTAKFSVVVVALQSTLIGLVLSLALILTRSQFPPLFTGSSEVESLVDKLTPTLVVCIIINNLQPILSGKNPSDNVFYWVAIGAGWQAFVAYVNIACYYLFGMPMGLLLGYTLGFGVQGIWIGMISGTFVQTFVLVLMIYRTNWNKEVSESPFSYQPGKLDHY